MKTKQFISLFLLLLFAMACTHTEKHGEANYETVPLPHTITDQPEAGAFLLDHNTTISYPSGNKELEKLATFLSDYIWLSTHIRIKHSPGYSGENALCLQLVAGNQEAQEDAYQLMVTANRIDITASGASGLFYGIQTFRKALPVGDFTHISFPAVTINDHPGFQHRGVSLDVSRHFFPVEFVKKYIDVLALFNMNVFHWHLTDDQGWRIEIKKYPELTTLAPNVEEQRWTGIRKPM
ncbi:MAG: family 20 glycosylhydrolase, partial [Tannerellaceae bacterium]|nr:family 20 glycosylhydrolase [Tannerellaceae bacterium]